MQVSSPKRKDCSVGNKYFRSAWSSLETSKFLCIFSSIVIGLWSVFFWNNFGAWDWLGMCHDSWMKSTKLTEWRFSVNIYICVCVWIIWQSLQKFVPAVEGWLEVVRGWVGFWGIPGSRVCVFLISLSVWSE